LLDSSTSVGNPLNVTQITVLCDLDVYEKQKSISNGWLDSGYGWQSRLTVAIQSSDGAFDGGEQHPRQEASADQPSAWVGRGVAASIKTVGNSMAERDGSRRICVLFQST
jgi:hypothetical protein